MLNDIIQQGGRLPYSFVVNEQQTQEQQERMKNIIQLMQSKKLILQLLKQNDDLEIDIEGSRAAHSGYKKYRKIKKWDKFMKMFNRVSMLFLMLVILGALGFLVYFLLHKFNIL